MLLRMQLIRPGGVVVMDQMFNLLAEPVMMMTTPPGVGPIVVDGCRIWGVKAEAIWAKSEAENAGMDR